MEVKVDSIHKAKGLIAQDWPTHIISIINDAGPTWPETTIDRAHSDHYIYSFHDVEDDQNNDLVLPSREVVAAMLEVAKDLPEDAKLLVHCSAGKSRSTAIAIGILCQSGLTPQEAFDKVKLMRPALLPNRLMIEYIDDILGLQGELIQVIADYYDKSLLIIPGLKLPNRGGYNR